MTHQDFLVIGSGLAGLTYALKIAKTYPDKQVTIVTKSDENESNTKYAQGGIAVVVDSLADSYAQHIEDTLRAGDGLCDPQVVEMVVKEAPERLNELLQWGASFDKNENGDFDLGIEGGHSQNRILHHKDITGLEIEKKLIAQVHAYPNIAFHSCHFAIDLITDHHLGHSRKKHQRCFGAYVLDAKTNNIIAYTAKITLLASGGAGQVYQNTSNPLIATGDGIAMAYRAKTPIKNMEFVQFHPTTLCHHLSDGVSFLISEAVRGNGAWLRNKSGERFMDKYDPRKELASRDIVSRAIDSELKKSGDEYVYLDCRHLSDTAFAARFPNIVERFRQSGMDWKKDMIPVVPAAHYCCGGIVTNEYGQTSIAHLYACGECAYTGLHGANRLASNSLLEALVFAHRCYLKSCEEVDHIKPTKHIPKWNEEGTTNPQELILITHNKKEVQALMSHYVGIVRTDQRLTRAEVRLKMLYEETEELYKQTKVSPQLSELRNLITVAYLIVRQSKERQTNAGGFFKEK